MRKYIALTAVLLLVGVGCKSTELATTTGTKTTTTVTAGEVVEDDRAPGVTDDAIKVGIAYPDFEALGDAVNINHGDYEAAYTAVIDDINEKGGVHGRELEAVFGPVDPSSATSTDDVCTKLTQDDPVFVAIGLFFGESVMCFVNVNETAVVGGEMTDERVAQARAPWFAYDVSSDSQVDAVNKLIDADDLKREGRRDHDRPGPGPLREPDQAGSRQGGRRGRRDVDPQHGARSRAAHRRVPDCVPAVRGRRAHRRSLPSDREPQERSATVSATRTTTRSCCSPARTP